MSLNPLQFEHEFARLKSRLAGQPHGDIALLALVSFWPQVQPLAEKKAFASYVEEYLGLLLDHTQSEHFADLNPDALQEISKGLLDVASVAGRFDLGQEYSAASAAVRNEWGSKLLYAGELAEGLTLFVSRGSKLEGQFASALHAIPGETDEFDALRLLVKELGPVEDPSAARLRSFLAEWEIVREGTSREYVNCLFVDRSTATARARGRLRELVCEAEHRSTDSTSHEVTFEHQIKSPDDPFVGVTYDALSAVIDLLGRPGQVRPRGRHIHAHLRIRDSDHAFTGDSIGLAAALVTYTQLLKQEVLRHERGIALGAVFTGGVDRDGRLLPVAEETLSAKVERAFFSPAKLLVVPAGNSDCAGTALAALERRYPRRQLRVVVARSLNEVIADRNIVVSEKVCAGQYVVRKAYRVGRMTRIQVPLLILLLYALVSLIYPPAWIGFDRNPAFVWVNDAHDRILVCNQDSTVLWSHQPDCVPVGEFHGVAHDLDGDGQREALYLAGPSEAVPCSVGTRLYVYNGDGELRFVRPASIVGQYVGDTAAGQYYRPRQLRIFEWGGTPYIVTCVTDDHPARAHLSVWSTGGERVGWYVHAGHVRALTSMDVNGDGEAELLGLGHNNRAGGMGLFVLPLIGCFGVSPPYSDPEYDLSGVTPGNELHYILFPTSDLARADSLPYDVYARFAHSAFGAPRVDVYARTMNVGSWRSYYLDSAYRVNRVIPSDIFWSHRQVFVAAGHLPAIDWDRYVLQQRDQVRYWTADGWRTEAELSGQED